MAASICAVCAIEGSGETEIQFLVVYEDAKGNWLYTEWDREPGAFTTGQA